jgi:hypothetical protein
MMSTKAGFVKVMKPWFMMMMVRGVLDELAVPALAGRPR